MIEKESEMCVEEEDEEDKDQNEEELEKLRPQIILDQSAQQDRDDDPQFDLESQHLPGALGDEEDEEEKYKEYLKEEDDADVII